MYFIYSSEKYLIKKQLNKLINNLKNNKECEIKEFSLIENPTNVILEEVITYSLFSSKKIIIITDSWFVTESKVKLHKDYNLKMVEMILNHKNDDIEVIFTLNSEKFSKRLKIVKLVESKTKLFFLEPPTNEQKRVYMHQKLKKNQIPYDVEAVEMFLNYIGNDLQVFNNELKKLVSLKKSITIDVVKSTINNYFQFNVFEILNAFMKGNLSEFLCGWNSYIEVNSNVFGFITLLSKQLITLRNAKLLEEQGFLHSQIALKLGKNPYIIKKILMENLMELSQINDKIKVLYTLEKKIKAGIVDKKVIPEVELIKMFCN